MKSEVHIAVVNIRSIAMNTISEMLIRHIFNEVNVITGLDGEIKIILKRDGIYASFKTNSTNTIIAVLFFHRKQLRHRIFSVLFCLNAINMYPGTHKEEPNTQNIKAWPEGYKDETEIRKRHHHNSSGEADRRREAAAEIEDDETIAQKYQGLLQGAEFYVFLALGSVAWYLLVKFILDWHRFPYHTYIVEVCFIIIVPIILLTVLLVLLDRRVR